MANEFGNSPVYSPSAPTGGGGGMATNFGNNMAASYGMPAAQQQFLWVGSSRPPKGMTPAKQAKLAGDSYNGAHPYKGKGDIFLTPGQLLSAFDGFGRKDYLKFRNLFIAAGLVAEDADAYTVRNAYQSIISETLDMQGQGIKMSPMQLIKNLIRKNGLNPGKIGADENFGTALGKAQPPTTTTQKTVYDLDPADARMTLEQAVQQKLGRKPSRAELEDFIAAAQAKAEEDPTTTTEKFIPGKAVKDVNPGQQVTVQREGGNVIGSTVTTVDQGFDANDVAALAERRAKRAPDYASYQAISTYFPAFLQALGATTPTA